MEVKIVQTKSKQNYISYRNPNVIEISIEIQGGGFPSSMRTVFKVHFGENVNWAEQYALGLADGKPVLIPVKNGGYKTRKGNTSTAGYLRFNLTKNALDVFGINIANSIRHDLKAYKEWVKTVDKSGNFIRPDINGNIELTGRIDDEQRVWINVDEYDKEANQ